MSITMRPSYVHLPLVLLLFLPILWMSCPTPPDGGGLEVLRGRQPEQKPHEQAMGLSGVQDHLQADIVPGTVVSDAAGTISTDSGWQPVFIGTDEIQTIMYGMLAGDGTDQTSFLLKEASTQDGWATSQEVIYHFSASYDIQYVSSERKDRFFVLGKSTGSTSPSEQIVERWTKKAISLIPVGGGPAGGQTVTMKRKELYRGSTLGEIGGIGADPDGRFLLVATRNPTRLLKLFPDGTTDIQFFGSQIPHLEKVTLITPASHEVLGRTWMLEGDAEWTLLSDIQNDGVFDSHQTMDAQTWDALYAFDSSWLDFFMQLE